MSLMIGIDPDLKKNGVCIYNKTSKTLESKSLSFFELFEYLKTVAGSIDVVKIEAGWLNKKSNFRLTKHKNIAERISKNVGENHATGKMIAEMCEFLQVNHKLNKPLIKRWKGPDGKITHEELEKVLTNLNIELKTRTNQDKRDSILICLF